MNITNFFTQFDLSTQCNHAENVAVLELLTLLYMVDNKVSLTEQKFVDDWVAKQITKENVNPKTVQIAAIATCRAALANNQANLDALLEDIAKRLNANPENAMETAHKLVLVDGEFSERERLLLERFANVAAAQLSD